MSTSFEKKNWITWNVICLLWIYQERKTGCPADFISTLIVWSNLRWWNGKSCCKVPVPTRTGNWSDIEHSTWNDDLLGIMTCCWLCMYATYKHIKSMVWRIPRWEVSGEESCLDGKRVASMGRELPVGHSPPYGKVENYGEALRRVVSLPPLRCLLNGSFIRFNQAFRTSRLLSLSTRGIWKVNNPTEFVIRLLW